MTAHAPDHSPPATHKHSLWEVFYLFLGLGCVSFGGPVAHMAYFQTFFVEQKKWLSQTRYTEIVALCQLLPGPSSSQVGLAIGYHRAGYRGAFLACLGFTLPSVCLLTVAALFLANNHNALIDSATHGLTLAACAVVMHAVFTMQRSLCADWSQRGVFIGSALLLLYVPLLWLPLLLIVLALLVGMTQTALTPPQVSAHQTSPNHAPHHITAHNKRTSVVLLSVFALLFVSLPIAAHVCSTPLWQLSASLYRASALVFGGGHVVLPLLEPDIVQFNLLSVDQFLAGYGLTQAVPGPLFSFAAYLGASIDSPHAVLSTLISTLAIFLPAYLLTLGVLPFWQHISQQRGIQHSMRWINAIVVGILLAAFINPIALHSIGQWSDLLIVLLAYAVLHYFPRSAVYVVLGCALAGMAWRYI